MVSGVESGRGLISFLMFKHFGILSFFIFCLPKGIKILTYFLFFLVGIGDICQVERALHHIAFHNAGVQAV